MNECLTTPQLKNKLAIGCNTNGKLNTNMYISKLKICNVIKYSECTLLIYVLFAFSVYTVCILHHPQSS